MVCVLSGLKGQQAAAAHSPIHPLAAAVCIRIPLLTFSASPHGACAGFSPTPAVTDSALPFSGAKNWPRTLFSGCLASAAAAEGTATGADMTADGGRSGRVAVGVVWVAMRERLIELTETISEWMRPACKQKK